MLEYYDSSMTSILRAQLISTYLTSTRFHLLNWKGSQANFILHYAEQARVYNEISSEEPFTDKQLITFLNSCLAGTPNLSQVLTLHRTAQTAAGVTKELKFPDYVSLLLEQAQVHDAGNTNTTNPRARRSVNTHDLIFEGADPDDDAEYEINQTEIHDEETPVEYLINRTEQGQKPRRTRIDYDTWKNLQKHDQEAWNKMSDEAKEAILSYAMKNMSSNKGVLKNSEKRTRFSSDNNRPRRANTHEQANDDSPTEDNGPPTIEASTHQILPKSAIKANVPHSSDFDDILTMAKTKTTSKSNPNAHITIDKILASEANAHEQYYTLSGYHLEAFVHKVNIDGREYDVESEDEDDFEPELQEEYVEEVDDDLPLNGWGF